jgi:hypothetical protein
MLGVVTPPCLYNTQFYFQLSLLLFYKFCKDNFIQFTVIGQVVACVPVMWVT